MTDGTLNSYTHHEDDDGGDDDDAHRLHAITHRRKITRRRVTLGLFFTHRERDVVDASHGVTAVPRVNSPRQHLVQMHFLLITPVLNYLQQRRSVSLRESHPTASGLAAAHPSLDTPCAETHTGSAEICVPVSDFLHRIVKIARVASLSTLTSGLYVPPPAPAAAETGARGTITAEALVLFVRAT